MSCQCEHPDQGRVSKGKMDDYLRDEAWFLPRLYNNALQAGMTAGSTEMKQFSRWVFMRARDLGAMGESQIADSLMETARTSAGEEDVGMRLMRLCSNLFGWPLTARLFNSLRSMKKRE